MFSKSTFVFAFLAVAKLAVATPPACLLSAINSQQSLGDFDTICGKNAKDVQQQIQTVCTGNGAQLALSAFADACKAKGVTVPTAAPLSSSASATKSANASQASSGAASGASGMATVTTGAGSHATGSASGSSSGSHTGSATAAQSTGAAGRIEGSIVGGMLALGAGILVAL